MDLAFVLLEDGVLPDAAAVVSAYARFNSDGPTMIADLSAQGGDECTFRLSDGSQVVVALMPAPIPNGEADEAAQFSVSAFGTGWQLPPHGAHLTVARMGPDTNDAVGDLVVLTRVVAALALAAKAVGVYWGPGQVTHEPNFFVDVTAEGGLPLLLWTGVSLAGDGEGRLSLLSLGMRQLDLPNLLFTFPTALGNDGLAFFFDLLGYLVERGTPLPEGDTVGRGANEELPVRYQRSPVDEEDEVWRVDVPA